MHYDELIEEEEEEEREGKFVFRGKINNRSSARYSIKKRCTYNLQYDPSSIPIHPMVIRTMLAFPDNCKFQKVVESIGEGRRRKIGIGPETLIYRIWNNKAVPRTNCSTWNQSLPKSTTRSIHAESSPVSSFGKYLNGRVIAFFFSPLPSFTYSRPMKIEWPLNGSKFQEWPRDSKFPFEKSRVERYFEKKFAPFLRITFPTLLSIF